MSKISENIGQEEIRLLIVDDDTDVLQAGRLHLKQHFPAVDILENPEEIPRYLEKNKYDVILLDMNFTRDVSSGEEGFLWLDRILKIDPMAVVILITAFGDVDLAVKAIKAGAMDFIQKPWQNEKLLATVLAGYNLRQSRSALARSVSREKMLSDDLVGKLNKFIGESSSIKNIFRIVDKVAPTTANVLILGENGTGKELVAREIHNQSPRSNMAFVTVDMGSIAETLFESELFGHIKGAYTDARSDRCGRIEMASGGTLFLDEIGNMKQELQAKLLASLESKTITRVGSNKSIPVDIRLICATNMPLYDMVDDDQFRQDLLYRINTVEINIPPLRDRPDDIPLLVDYFLHIYSQKYGKSVTPLSQTTFNRLKQYAWPGNVRELSHAIERAVIMAESSRLTPEDFLLSGTARKKSTYRLDTLHLETAEKEIVRRAMVRFSGNVSKAAKALGLTRASLYRRIQKYDI